jgi:hypothetical protein
MVVSMLPDEQEKGHKASPPGEEKKIDRGGTRRQGGTTHDSGHGDKRQGSDKPQHGGDHDNKRKR